MNSRIEKGINNAFNKLKMTRDERKIDDVSDQTLSLFKLKNIKRYRPNKAKEKKTRSKYNLQIPQ